MKSFIAGAEKALEAYLKSLRDKLVRPGTQVLEWIDGAGNFIRETLDATVGSLVREIFFGSNAWGYQASRTVFDAIGATTWNFNQIGEIIDTAKWSKITGEGIGAIEDLLILQINSVDRIFRVWNWDQGGIFTRFGKYAGSLDPSKMVLSQFRAISGDLTQTIFKDGLATAVAVFTNSTLAGVVFPMDLQKLSIRHVTGEVQTFVYDSLNLLHPLIQIEQYVKAAENFAVQLEDLVQVRLASEGRGRLY